MTDEWPTGEKPSASRIIKGGWRPPKIRNKSINAQQFGNHEGLTKRAVEGEARTQANNIRAQMNSLLTLHDRVECVIFIIKEVQTGKIVREAVSAGLEGFVQELRLAHEKIETEKLRARRKK